MSATAGEGDSLLDGAQSPELRQCQTTAAQHEQRLDKALVQWVPEFSRSYLQQLLTQGVVRVNSQVVSKAAHKLRLGDQVTVELHPTEQSQAFRPEAMALDVVYEDAHLLVLNKPAGLVVHPAPGHWSGTLLNGLLARDASAAQLERAGIVHRLDKDTSGLLVVARSAACQRALIELLSERRVTRQYAALAWGRWQGQPQRSVQQAIGRDPQQRLRMAVVDLAQHPGKPARTDIECVQGNEQLCLVRCSLHTGRTHQIRVHMAWLGHPLVADALYGGKPLTAMTRQALHAYRLAFTHPMTGQALEFFAPLPADFQQSLDSCRLSYNFPQ